MFFHSKRVPRDFPLAVTQREIKEDDLKFSEEEEEKEEEVKDGEQPPTPLVSRWVDYTSKYGLGYRLTNGQFGALFNDATSMIYLSRFKLYEYQDKSGLAVQFSDFLSLNREMKKKLKLLHHFISFLEGAH